MKSRRIVPGIILGIMIYAALNIFKNNTIFYNLTTDYLPYVGGMLFVIFIIIGVNINIINIFR